jgi:exopolysaccharide production protein ExoZ
MPVKIQRVQYLRAFAAFTVVLAHAIGDYKAVVGIDLLPMHYLGAAGVDLFFVISGFVMVQSSGHAFGSSHSAAVFLMRRWFRVAPLYWIIMAVYALLQIAQGKWNIIDAPRILSSALFFPLQAKDGSMAPFYGIGWTLNYEMFFYAVFALWLGARRGAAISGTALTISALVIIGQIWPLPTPLNYWFNAIILDFMYGVLIAWAYDRGWKVTPQIALICCSIAVVLVIGGGALGFNALLPEMPTIFPRCIAWGLPAAIVVASVTLCRSDLFERSSKIGRALGDASYSMYLLHPIVIILLRKAIPALALMPDTIAVLQIAMGIGHIAGVLVLTSILSLVSFAIFERPMIRLGHLMLPYLRRENRSSGQPGLATRLKSDLQS